MIRFLVRVPLAAALLATTVGIAGTAAWAASGKCTVATTGNSPPARACATGGREAAGKVMKEMVKQGKEKGLKFTCETCHNDMESFVLTPNAREDFKKLEAVQKK